MVINTVNKKVGIFGINTWNCLDFSINKWFSCVSVTKNLLPFPATKKSVNICPDNLSPILIQLVL